MVKPSSKTKAHPSATKGVALLPPSDVEGDEMTPELRAKIEKLMKFFDTNKLDYEKLNIDDKKTAYPNYDSYMSIPGQHDMGKWLKAVRDVYFKEKNGSGRVDAIRQSTSGWKPMEVFDFLNWLKYYEEGAHMKYKYAQLWYENGAPGYFLEIKPDAQKQETTPVNGTDIDAARDAISQELSNAEKKRIIEKQRNKIIGRLDSAEKLLRSPDGQLFAGPELENLMETIFTLKKKVQLVNKLSTSVRLYEDMIVREANVLRRKGFYKAAEVLHSVAQANNPPPPGLGTDKPTDLTPDSPGDPSGAGHPGAPGGLPSVGPGMPQGAPPSAAPESGPNEMSPSDPKTPGNAGPTSGMSPAPPMQAAEPPAPPGINEFLRNMETANLSDTDNLEVHDQDEELTVEAQMAIPPMPPGETLTDSPPPAPLNPRTPTKSPKPEVAGPGGVTGDDPIEVTEGDVAPPGGDAGSPAASNFDNKVDQVFSNLTVADVVSKLEDLAKVYKTRELPRQLSIVDMMLDSLGLASYFPSLSEAQNKALESNNYISTRIEDILARLRGAISTKEVDLKGETNPESPEVAGIKGKLQDADEKEKQRKQMRKDQEAAELAGKSKEAPQVEMNEDLGGPVAAPAAPPAPAKPAARPLG